MAKKKKLPKFVRNTIIPLSVLLVFCIVLFIVNFFVPVRYLTAYFAKAAKREQGVLTVTFLDIGFGDSALVEFPDGKIMLVDGGDGAYPRQLKLLTYLNKRGVDKIDYLVCTSVKDEHCGGLAEIVKYKKVEKAFVPYVRNARITDEYSAFYEQLRSKKVPYTYAAVGEGATGGSDYDYFFTFLSPTDRNSPASEYVALNASPNNQNIEKASAVLWVQYGGTGIAFTSDSRDSTLKRAVDDYLLTKALNLPYCRIGNYAVDLTDCKITTVPAHGGEDNTYARWYEVTKPEKAVLSVGKNFASYPSAKAIMDACAFSEALYTDKSGNITVTVRTDGYELATEK